MPHQLTTTELESMERSNMSTFVMLTRLAGETARSPAAILSLEQHSMRLVRSCCPDVSWRASFALLGPHDYCDIFEAPSLDIAFQVSALMRTIGHANTEVWPATPWHRFKAYMHQLANADRETDVIYAGPPPTQREIALDAADVELSLGAANDAVVAAILELEPTFTDFEMALRAFAMRHTEDHRDVPPLSEKANLIVGILAQAELFEEEDEGRI
jgi:uncharacterized protein with GYD domain